LSLVLGIDPATACGWALLDELGERVAGGVWDLSVRRGEGGGMRFLRCERMLRELLANHNVVAVGYERPGHQRSLSAQEVLQGLKATIERVCEELRVHYTCFSPGEVKKEATGNGNAGKPEMVAAARKKWGHPVSGDDNAADALWVAELLRQDIYGRSQD
jgi:Holliday junction resolvasome RuvABC endonuclease subunit